MRAWLSAAGLNHAPRPAAAGEGGPASGRIAAARGHARARRDRQRQVLRPLGWVFIVVVVAEGLQGHPAPGLRGVHLGVSLSLALYVVAAAVALTSSWAERGPAAQAAVIGLVGGSGVALAAVQPPRARRSPWRSGWRSGRPSTRRRRL